MSLSGAPTSMIKCSVVGCERWLSYPIGAQGVRCPCGNVCDPKTATNLPDSAEQRSLIEQVVQLNEQCLADEEQVAALQKEMMEMGLLMEQQGISNS